MKFNQLNYLIPIFICVAAAFANPSKRGAYYANETDGFNIQILDARRQPIQDYSRHVFKTGEKFSLEVSSNFAGYLYVVNVSPNGQRRLLCPINSESNIVTAKAPLVYPQKGVLIFDKDTGAEKFEIYVSNAPIASYESLRTSPSKSLKATESVSAVPEKTVIPEKTSEKNGVGVTSASQMRGVHYEADRSGILVAPSSESRLQEGGVIGVTVILQHE